MITIEELRIKRDELMQIVTMMKEIGLEKHDEYNLSDLDNRLKKICNEIVYREIMNSDIIN